MLHKELLTLYSPDGNERVGFILRDNSVVEVENTHPIPSQYFDVSAKDLIEYCDHAIASFHTHPGHNNNLSVNDQQAFLAWPHLIHYIIGCDGIQAYVVKKNMVVKIEA